MNIFWIANVAACSCATTFNALFASMLSLLACMAIAHAASDAPSASSPDQRDAAAGKFMTTCAGCHSLTGQKLVGPDLSHVGAWPVDQLKMAIELMQGRAGNLSQADIDVLADFLRSPNVRDRIKAEESRMRSMFAAKLDPPNADIGRRLFFGEEPLKEGGLQCAACHTVSGNGGNLGPDLTAVFSKMGETPLISAIEKASFKIMEPHYRWKPVSKQEAVHLAKFLSSLDPKTVHTVQASFVPIGGGSALALFVGLIFHLRAARKNRGRDTKLQGRRK